MRVSMRLWNGSPRVCFETENGTFDVGALLIILSTSKHGCRGQALNLKNKCIWNYDNFLAQKGTWELLQEANRLLSSLLKEGELQLLEEAKIAPDAAYFPPIRKPPLMFGLAGNCSKTWRNSDAVIPVYPVGYTRPWRSVSPHNGRVVIDKNVTSFRCAAELGVVIGKEAFRVSREDAFNYVCGYTCVNDMISNHWKDFAYKHNPAGDPTFEELLITSYYGRGTDGFGPLGPYITSKEAVDDPYNLLMLSRHNEKQLDRSFTGAMIVGIEKSIEYLSGFMTLSPGSIIHMGTMGIDGITFAEDVKLGANDYVEIEIEKVGILRTYFDDKREIFS